MGLTVVGKLTAGTMTSSPGRSPSGSWREQRVVMATRLADEPELTGTTSRTPMNAPNCFSNCSAYGPAVSQKSSTALTMCSISVAS